MDQPLATSETSGYIDGPEGGQLFYRSWLPAGPARASLAIVPGFNSHSGYFARFGEEMAARGIAAYALDLRGRGKSDGERFYVDSFDDYVSDVGRLMEVVRSRHAGLPAFLMGHSAGGIVACLFTLDHGQGLAGLVSESFAFELPAPDFAVAALKGLSHIAPHAHVLALKNADFSRDPASVVAMDADPLIAHETQPTRTLAAIARADERLRNAFGRITLPVLILHGTEDKAAKPAGSQFFYDHAGSSDKTLKLYEGGYHDPLNDLERERVSRDIGTWLEAHLS